jgi:cellulase/cellobiase CelA1
MQSVGADHSVNEFYHSWFNDNTTWDNVNDNTGPAPGFLVGGANQYYTIDGLYMNNQIQNGGAVKDQPSQKRYTDSNDRAYQTYLLSENSITYQAPYIRLLAKFLSDNIFTSDEVSNETSTEISLNSNEVSLAVNTTVTDQWNGGYCAKVSVGASVSINDWQFQFNLSGKMGDIWLANQSDLGNNHYLITPVLWTHLIWANDSQEFGFCAEGDPQNISVSASRGHTYPDQQAKDFSQLRVDMWLTGLWEDSYCMNVNITNLTNTAVTWKEVRLSLPDSQLTGNWSGNFFMQEQQLIIQPASWNSHLGLGADSTVSFCADGYNNLGILSAEIQ